ncbi:rabenosyn-5-like [Watersipora subatra]|uniref:rabenosyn-5-like n=1 Tax=Watersipora subatra TaxID=2589382 RepID=UPI00355C0849
MAQVTQHDPSSPLAREGFICPICLQDQGDAHSLAVHFEKAHNAEDNVDILDQVKGFFGKAKKLFTLDDEEYESPVCDSKQTVVNRNSFISATIGQVAHFETQDIGKTRNMTDFFKGIRDATVDRTVVECNKLVIRLSKLTGDDVPEEGPKRRAFEQSIVSWDENGACPNCLTCGKGFNIRRRRHHCRLCGGIMCDKCSDFLPFTQARLVSNAATASEVTVSQPTFLRRSNSNSSLNSIGSKEAGPALRMCSKCRQLIELHNRRQEQRSLKPTISVLYEQLQRSKSKSEELTREYVKVAFSLCSGETTHSLEKAGALRQGLAKSYSEIEGISKRIMTLKGSEAQAPSGTATKLQLSIRAFAIAYIQDCSATLPSLPDEKQLQELVTRKEQERKQKIREQLERVKENSQPHPTIKKRTMQQHTQPSSREVSAVTTPVATGWTPGDVYGREVQDGDPMVQQMNIIRGYLKQAKMAQRHDEVEMLEDNLRHLEEEYYKQPTCN